MFFYTLFYFLFSFLLIYPPVEFVTAGLTIPTIFSKLLGSESESFVEYHLMRIAVTRIVHACLPLGYIVGLFFNDSSSFPAFSTMFSESPAAIGCLLYITISLAFMVRIGLMILEWSRDSWANHPVLVNLKMFCSLTNRDCKFLVSSVNIEFRRFDKVSIQTNSTSKVYVTDSWIIKISMYNVNFAHQNDATLFVTNSDTHQLTPTGGGETQFINIEVRSNINVFVHSFNFRLIAQDFKDLQDKIRRPIIILPDIVFHKTIIDKFIDVFKEQVAMNEKYSVAHESDMCLGCMLARSNVKLTKMCSGATEEELQLNPRPPDCVQCNCRPMWCLDCMARWFASRQDPEQMDHWLSNKCSCPVCRATFCLLDVALVQEPQS